MENIVLDRKQNASITVFLSLILLVVLSLIMTVIEGARQTAARVIAERSFTTAMDSVLAGFYGPLMEEYHLLGLDLSGDQDMSEDSQISEIMGDYISYTINPRQNFSETDASGELYGISLESLKVKNKTRLMDYEGDLFIHEATEYMKYCEIGNLAEFLLDKASLLEQPKKVCILLEEKEKLEEELVVIDEGILALMKYLDGVSTGKKGLLTGKGGKLKTEKYFAKKILFETPTMENTGINNQNIFLALQDKYINPSGLFTAIINDFNRLQEILRKIAEAEAEANVVQSQIDEARSAAASLENTLSGLEKDDETDRKSVESQIDDIASQILNLESKAEDISKSISNYINQKSECISTITSQAMEIKSLISGGLSTTEQAIFELEQIIEAAENAKPKLLSYEDNLKKNKDDLDKDIYGGLEEGLNEYKKYLPENNKGCDFTNMKEILKKNFEVLKNCEAIINEGYQALSGMEYEKAKDKYSNAYNNLLQYRTGGLNLDYSSLVIQKEDSPDFIGKMADFIDDGIAGLVIDKEKISDKELDSDNLPSKMAELSQKLKEFSFPDLLKKIKIGNKNSGLDVLFGSFDDVGILSLLGDSADAIGKRILLIAYINEHFYEFTLDEDKQKARKPSALNYEQEYLIYGKKTDEDNLKAVINKLVFIRTVLNFISIFGDSGKRNEAKALAATLVGFTGLSVLIYITQTILITLLALLSGLVDTCALLMGKEVAFFKKIQFDYTDILSMTRESIQKKAEAYKEKGFSYNDYMSLFLLLTGKKELSYRMMDLIQENIKIRYGTNFNFQKCIFGFEAEAAFHAKPLFTTFAFVRKYLNSDFKGDFTVSAGYSY